MKLVSLDNTPFSPVSHDPQLKKRVLMGEGFSCIKHISHIVLRPGDSAVEHVHDDGYEVFYCIRGETVFTVRGGDVTIRGGDLFIVEPGEAHSIVRVAEDTELVYFFAFRGG